MRGGQPKKRGYLGLGANLGDRAETLKKAVVALQNWGRIEVVRQSGAYETAPVGPQDQPAFLNMVVEIETTLGARELFAAVKKIEEALGRQSRVRWGAREIDIDILLLDEEKIDEADLKVPHPHILERAFVMVPLAELAPDMILAGERAADIAARLAQRQQVGGKLLL